MPSETIVYRTLQTERPVGNGEMHDELKDFLERNPFVLHMQNNEKAEAYHEVHEGTHWDQDINGWPKKILEEQRRRLKIVVGLRGKIAEELLSKPPEFEYDERRRFWRVANKTAIVRVTIEKIIKEIPVTNSAGFLFCSHFK